MRKILCITLLILAAALSVAAQKSRTQKSRTQKSRAQKPLAQNPVAQNPVVQNPVAQNPVVQKPVVQKPVVQNLRAQHPLVQDNADPFLSEWQSLAPITPAVDEWQPLATITPAVDESPGTQFSPDLEGYNDLTGLATYADAQAQSHTNLVTIDVVYSYRSYVMPGNSGDAFLGNVINVQGPNGALRLWMPFSANAGYWVGFICNMEGYARYRNLRMTYDADCGIVTALDYR